jgi:hypothetical protein
MTLLVPPPEVLSLFERAGWYVNRHVTESLPIPFSHPAAQILASFAGLEVQPESEAGIECATSDINFGPLSEDDSLVAQWAALLETDLVGFAEYHCSHGALYVASDGRCYGLSYIHPAFYYCGSTFSDAIIKILKGYKAKPMLLPNQDEVTLYGETHTTHSPDLYDYKAHSSSDST